MKKVSAAISNVLFTALVVTTGCKSSGTVGLTYTDPTGIQVHVDGTWAGKVKSAETNTPGWRVTQPE